MQETITLLLHFSHWLLLAAFIVLELVSWARNGCSLFWLLGKLLYRKINSSGNFVCISIPQRCQYMIMNNAIEIGAKIKIEATQPLISEHEHITLTSKESGLTPDSTYYVHKITRRNFYLSKNSPSNYSLSPDS